MSSPSETLYWSSPAPPSRTSSPPLPSKISLPRPPSMILADPLPVIVSLPDPSTTFSILSRVSSPICPPALTPEARLTVVFDELFDKSNVSDPLPPIISSSPAPPSMVSSPALPKMISSSAPPTILSSAEVPATRVGRSLSAE